MLEFLIQKKLPFAIWSLPGEREWHGIAQDDTEVDELDLSEINNAEGFIVAPFESLGSIKLIRSDIEFNSKNFSLETESEENDQSFKIMKANNELFIIDRDSYLKSCANMINCIGNGKVEKAVLSKVKAIPFDNNKLIRFFKALIREHQNALVFIYSTGNEVWIGASPEVFIEVRKNSFKTIALAGSKPANDNSDWGKKELEEQQYVSRFIEGKLINAGLRFKQSDLTTIIAGPIAHLQTIFTGRIENKQLPDLIQQLHPTPAVCGVPKEEALDLIRKIENHHRGDYTGYIGPVKRGEMSLFVNLRSAMLTNEKMYLFLGGGITAGSIPEKEWEETELKAKTLLNCYKNC